MPNLVSVNRFSSLQKLNKTQTGVFSISGFLVKSLVNKSCHNSGTSRDIDMKLEPVTKLDKRNRSTSKKIDHDFVSANHSVTLIFPIDG